MGAQDYKLVVSPLTNTVFISKVSKKHPHVMTNDRREVPKEEFMTAILQWVNNQVGDGNSEVNINLDGKTILKLTPIK